LSRGRRQRQFSIYLCSGSIHGDARFLRRLDPQRRSMPIRVGQPAISLFKRRFRLQQSQKPPPHAAPHYFTDDQQAIAGMGVRSSGRQNNNAGFQSMRDNLFF